MPWAEPHRGGKKQVVCAQSGEALEDATEIIGKLVGLYHQGTNRL